MLTSASTAAVRVFIILFMPECPSSQFRGHFTHARPRTAGTTLPCAPGAPMLPIGMD
jgi:hypothetical protein